MKHMLGRGKWVVVCDKCNRSLRHEYDASLPSGVDICSYCTNMGMIRNVLAKVVPRTANVGVRKTVSMAG